MTANILGVGPRSISRVRKTEDGYVGYASVGGKRKKVSKPFGRGRKNWTLA